MSHKQPKIISAYSPKLKVVLKFPENEGRTKQQFNNECDINQIITQNNKTGVFTHLNTNAPQYGVASSTDFQEALNTIIESETMFSELPSLVRKRFDNDPTEFLKFVETKGNEDELRTMGLLDPKKPADEPPAASQPPSGSSSEPPED